MNSVEHIIRKEKTNREKRLIDLVKRKREKSGIDQIALSREINRSYTYIKRVEEGRKVYTQTDLNYLSRLFNCNFEELIME